MDKIKNGGLAFPSGTAEVTHTQEHGYSVRKELHTLHEGMTLRDYFATKAMPSCYAEYCAYANAQGYSEDWRMGVALDSYAMADAMIEAREANHG